MSHYKILLLFLITVFLSSCEQEDKGSKDVITVDPAKSDAESRINLIVFFVPGLDQDIMSLLHDDPNSENLRKFKTIGAYGPKSYFENYSDFESNMTAIMSGKTTLNGHLGIDKDSIADDTWLRNFKNENYQIAYVTDKSLGSIITGAIFTGEQTDLSVNEKSILNMVRFEPQFIWGMGTNLFTRRTDRKNLFEEMSIKGYQISLDINNLAVKGSKKFAGVFNNYSLPDSIDLLNSGLVNWSKFSNKDSHILILSFLGLSELLESKDKKDLYKINRYIDYIVNIEDYDPKSYLFLIINPFQDFHRDFSISHGDTLNFNSRALEYNQMDNNVWAYGVHSESFSGFYQNSDFYKKIDAIKKSEPSW